MAKEVIKQLEVVYPQVREEPHLARTTWFGMAMTNPASFNNLTSSIQQTFRTAMSTSSSGSGRGAVSPAAAEAAAEAAAGARAE